jgi:hypothetical protein
VTGVLWGASVGGVSNKLPTREGNLNTGQVTDNLETVSGLVLAKVGDVSAVPDALVELAGKVVEFGAAALTEMQDFPEQSTRDSSPAASLWAQYELLAGELQAGVEALGGEPDVQQRPAYMFPPPSLTRYQRF